MPRLLVNIGGVNIQYNENLSVFSDLIHALKHRLKCTVLEKVYLIWPGLEVSPILSKASNKPLHSQLSLHSFCWPGL